MRRAFLLIVAACAGAAWAFWPRPALSHETISTTVLFDREIVRILNKKCVACHADKNLAFPLTTYEETRPWARSIKEEALRRHMPPWRAAPGYGQLVNDIGLTTRELDFIVSWVEGNGPKSAGQTIFLNVKEPGAVPGARVRAQGIDQARWQLGTPDLLRQLSPNTVQPGQANEVKRAVVDLGLTSERWVRALEFKPSDRRVVRAAFFTLQETGQWLGSWTPWYGITSLPDSTAYRLPAGSHVVAELYYRGADEAVEERGSLGLFFATAPPANRPSDLVLQASGQLPASAAAQKLRARTLLAADTYAVAVRPELLEGAQTMELAARRPDGSTQVLLYLKDILPNWPTPYIFKEPVLLPKGTDLSVTTYYANPNDKPQPGGLRLTVSRYEKAGRAATAN